MAASGSSVYITWWELQQNGTRESMLKASSDNGKTFGPALRLGANGTIGG